MVWTCAAGGSRTLGFLCERLTPYPLGQELLLFCPMCGYSNSRNDIPQVAQRYGTIATHTRCSASVLFVFVVFCMHMHSFAGLIRQTPPLTFIHRHSDTTIFQLREHWVQISWSFGPKKNGSDMSRWWELNP